MPDISSQSPSTTNSGNSGSTATSAPPAVVIVDSATVTSPSNTTTSGPTPGSGSDPRPKGAPLNNASGQTRTMLPPDCTLYVSELDPNTTEAHLFAVFAQFGHIRSIRVIKDQLTRRSLGYAYVNYSKPEFAQAALADTTPKILLNRLCKVAQFHHKKDRQVYQQQRDRDRSTYSESVAPSTTTLSETYPSSPNPSSSSANHASIFIKNLDPTITSAMLYDMFSSCGAIVSCKITMNEFGFSRGFGYISFTEKAAADAAIEKLNGALVNDRKVFVCHHMHKWERNQLFQELKHNFTSLFIKNVDMSASDSDVYDLFAKFGAIESVSLARDPIGRPKGFAFVKYKSHDDAVKTLQLFDDFAARFGDDPSNIQLSDSEQDLRLFGRVLVVTKAQHRRDRVQQLEKQHQDGVNLYVKNLDESIDEKQLQDLFSRFGNVVSTKIMTDINTGLPRGFGFVCFSTPQEATRALEEMNDTEVLGQQLIVTPAQRRNNNKHMSPYIGNLSLPMSPGMPLMSPPLSQPSINSSPIAGGAAAYYGSPLLSPVPYYYPPPTPNPAALYGPNPGAWNMVSPNLATALQHQHPQGVGISGVPIAGFALGPNNTLDVSVQNVGIAGPPAVSPSASSPVESTPPVNSNNNNNNNYEQYRSNGRQGTQRNKVKQTLSGSSLVAAVASAADSNAEKTILGEAIYPHVFEHPAVHFNPQVASKITGMLLEQDKNDLLRWMDDLPKLKRRIQQAHGAYMEFVTKAEA